VKAPARAIVDNLVWSSDGGVWAVWQVQPFPHAHTGDGEKLAVHARVEGALIALPGDSMLLSVCERRDAWDVVAEMIDGVDLDAHPAWAEVASASAEWLGGRGLYRRRYYLAGLLPQTRRQAWRDPLRLAGSSVADAFGLPVSPIGGEVVDVRRRQAEALAARLRSHLNLVAASAGELRWLYGRSLRREIHEPALDESWEPARGEGSAGVVAHLTDAVVKEGGFRDDPDRPRHRRYVRVDTPQGTAFQTVLAVADLPHEWTYPGGGGEFLFHVDDLGFPVDWCVRVRSIPNADAQLKVRRQHRQLVGQLDEYDGEVTGLPPSLGEALAAVDAERAELAARPAEPELQATILLSLAAATLAELEDHAAAVSSLLEPHEYGVGRPTGGQVALIRSMLPGSAAASVCRDYTQFLLPRDLAAGAPFCGPELGDPSGHLLGVGLDGGVPSPVLFDPTYGPQVGRSASLAAVGALGSGKSFLLKRLCWDTVARGGQVVTVDRTAVGEYARFAGVVPGRADVIRLGPDAEVCIDPMRTFSGEQRVSVTLGFLSLLAGCTVQSEEGAAVAEAVHEVASDRSARLGDVVDRLRAMGEDPDRPDEAARSIARRLDHYRRMGTGRLAFGDGPPLELDADFIVFWLPNLALPDRDSLLNEHLARQMLPEEILGHALLYLVAAVGREVVFRDPSRFGAALYDEAWALYSSPHGQRLLLEGIRDGRKHNGAIWLSTQHPRDLGDGELIDLLGARFVFRQSHGAIEPACQFIGVPGSAEVAAILARHVRSGECLFRDVRDRVGLLRVLPPLVPGLLDAFDTTPPVAKPPTSSRGATEAAAARRRVRSARHAPAPNP
jgi:hypothetical protein